LTYRINDKTTFEALVDKICRDVELKLKNPSISTDDGKALYLSNKALRDLYTDNLQKTIGALFKDHSILNVTDASVLGKRAAKIKIIFEGAIYTIPREEQN